MNNATFSRSCFTWLLFLLVLFVFSQSCLAADPIQPGDQQQFSPNLLKAKIAAVSENSQLDDATKNKLLELYRRSLENISSMQANENQANYFVASITSSPEEIKKVNSSIKKLETRKEAKLRQLANNKEDRRPLKELEQELIQSKAQETELEAALKDLTRQSGVFTDRPAKISQRLAEIKDGVDAVNGAVKVSPQPGDNPEITKAQNMVNLSKLASLQSESRMLNQELVSMPVRSELINAKRDEFAVRLELVRLDVQALEDEVNAKRQEEANKSVGAAQEVVAKMADNQPVLQQEAAKNAAYSEQLLKTSDALKTSASARDTLTNELSRIEETYASTKQKIEVAGLSHALGLLLHDIQRNLPDDRQLAKKRTQNSQVIAETGLQQVQAEDEKKKIDDSDNYIREILGTTDPATAKELKPELRKIIASRSNLLDKIIAANRTYLSQLSEIELLYTNLLGTVKDFSNYLQEHLLWMRSTPPVNLKGLAELPQEMQNMFAIDRWIKVGHVLVHKVLVAPVFLLVVIFCIVLYTLRKMLIQQLEAAVNLAGNPTSYHFGLPLKALALSVILALPCPLLIGAAGWKLQVYGESSEFSRAVGTALLFFSLRFFYLRIIIEALRSIGLASRVFFWSREKVDYLRRETQKFLFTFLPVAFFTQISFYVNYQVGSSHTLGRLSIIILLGVIMFFALRLFHPQAIVWQKKRANSTSNLLGRLQPFLFAVTLILPLVLAGLVLAGYIFAAGGLLGCLLNTIWLSFALVVGHQILERWLIQSGRQLALKKAWQHTAQEMAENAAGNVALPPEAEAAPIPEENLADLSQDSRKLLNALVLFVGLAGLWWVWNEVFPALRMFNHYTLWTNVIQINGQAQSIPVSVADAGMTVFIGFLTVIGIRHLPALLTIILLKRLQVSAGSRYTVVTLTRYGIGGAGLMYIADVLGFSWSQIQWLVAALGVGIGFGLQEIVANFISGIIILFERPIRLGDVVTVDSTVGVVTRIRIRATTIRDFDGKELLVPNKEFISSRLLNWSLSDPINRIILPVGVAYGSDVGLAMHLMQQAAENEPLVLKEPRINVTFDSFGDNSLLLNLRFFVNSVDDRLVALTRLHLAIDKAFREANISISFPQRDVHLDTTSPLEVHLVHKKELDKEREDEGGEESKSTTEP
nr:mechanosensitive ion channel domain-containing protein [uncultured Desulfobulbus sp.]